MQLYSDHYKEMLKELHARQDRPRGFGGKIKPLGLFDTFMNNAINIFIFKKTMNRIINYNTIN